jgi:hypothetical protein
VSTRTTSDARQRTSAAVASLAGAATGSALPAEPATSVAAVVASGLIPAQRQPFAMPTGIPADRLGNQDWSV